ncbi:MAG: dTDP-4-dehydrorhamnose 3,5-epimerase [Hydrotalea sp.]|nr:dTDP-4-dehydrorhamnose 3,5-epimerase [Hydrotalea sp.]
MAPIFLNYLSITQLSVIETVGGSVLKGLSKIESSYTGFGEAYFSEVEPGAIKAWKYHKEMTLNLIVPLGTIKFVFCIQENGKSFFQEIIIGRESYSRITVKPGIWFGFQGLDKETSLLMNVADIVHKPDEVERLELNEILYNW